MNTALISARGISLCIQGNTILDQVDLSVSFGEILTLIGQNGSGKTTLLKALMGLVKVQGEITRHLDLKVGYVPQQFARDPCLPVSVEDFLALFAPRAAGLAALERTGVLRLRKSQMNILSGGELARVLLARAISARPNLLVLDEPTASVDMAGEAALYHLIGEIRDELNCGVLLVSHDLYVVMARSDRVVCLNRHICCQGSPEHVMQDPAFRTLFGNRAPQEMAPYIHHHSEAGGEI